MKHFVAVLMLMLLLHGPGFAADFYVAPGGSDENPGTKEKPLASLEAARDAIRGLKEKSKLPEGGVTVWLRAGDYFRKKTFELSPEDSGEEGKPVVYRAFADEAVHLVGGLELKTEWFSKLTSSSPAWERLDAAARSQVYQVDLKAHGVEDYGKLAPRGYVKPGIAAMELFFDGRAMQLARWPNEGFARTAGAPGGKDGRKFTYAEERPEKWAKAEDAWVAGYFNFGWADNHVAVSQIDTAAKTLSVQSNPAYGIITGAPYYALNILEELDRPGEWYLDRARGVLYFWSPQPLGQKKVYVSLLEGDMVSMTDASYVMLRGLTLEASRGQAVKISKGAHNRLEGCTFRNLGTRAVTIDQGLDHGVEGCEIYGCGTGGVFMEGGDRQSLTPCGHFVRNCVIHHTSRWCRTYNPAIDIRGVGCQAAHNWIHDAPHFAIWFKGNGHVIEYNKIDHVCQETNDSGAIYTGRDWGGRGSVIRYNFIHDLDSPMRGRTGVQGVYLDDCASGNVLEGNVFYKITGYAILIGGGRDNVIENNVMARCGRAVHIDQRGMSLVNQIPGNSFNLLEQIEHYNYTKPPWSTKYPALAAIMKDGYDEAKRPKGNLLTRNVGFGNEGWLHENMLGTLNCLEQKDNLSEGDPLFVDEAQLNLQFKEDSPALKIPGFKKIPLDQIGPEKELAR